MLITPFELHIDILKSIIEPRLDLFLALFNEGAYLTYQALKIF